MIFGSGYPDPLAFLVGAFAIRWYAVLILAGIAVALYVITRLRRRSALPESVIWDALTITLIAGIVGSRFGYVISHLSQYSSFVDTLKVWEGGMAIHGGIIAGIAALAVYAWTKQISFWVLADLLAPGLAVGQAIGRWGNYFNQEAFGRPTSLPWGVPIAAEYRPDEFFTSTYFHPAWLYESLWDLAVFVILLLLSSRLKSKPGSLAMVYLALYYVGRFILEFVRLDVVQAGFLTIGQWLALVAVGVSVGILVRISMKGNSTQPSI